jgi:hypothetical protein
MPLMRFKIIMMNVVFRRAGCMLLLLGLGSLVQAQFNGLLQQNDLSDQYRVLQLTDTATAGRLGVMKSSFLLRAMRPWQTMQQTLKPVIGFTELSYSRYFNDSIGGGYNNESFYNATGWQERISVGVKAQYGRVHLQLQPEWVMAQNKVQAVIPADFKDANFFSRYYFYNINTIDLPSRPGTARLNKLFPGQSFLRYEFKSGIAAGISTENIWWGPGLRNSLIMTNNAPGFLHIGAQTLKPLETGWGTIEGQVLLGWLDSSGVTPTENVRQFAEFWPGAYVPKISESKRAILSMMMSWQPKWVPNLFIGFAASRYYYTRTYNDQGQPFEQYPYSTSPQNTYYTALGSMFMRYVMPGDRTEIYAEFGRADKVATLFNLFGDTIPLAYTAGIRKVLPLGPKAGFIDLVAEVSHLALPDPRLIFSQDNPFGIPKTRSWYTHPRIRQGYTQHGQLLGAGIGPGSNSQTLSITWIKGFNRLGIMAERVAHNKDFYYYSHIAGAVGYGIHNQYWTDLSLSLHGQYTWKQLQLAAAITNLSALNYRWVKVDGAFDGPSRSDVRNWQMAVSLRYLLK